MGLLMKFVSIYFLLIFLSSCADIQKATNINILDDEAQKHDLDGRVTFNENDIKGCTFISKVRGDDNLLHPGKESALRNMKIFSKDKGGNTIYVSECKTLSDSMNLCLGKVYKCP
jgi:hypothetical protein